MKDRIKLLILIPIFSFVIISLIYNLDLLSKQTNSTIINQANKSIATSPISLQNNNNISMNSTSSPLNIILTPGKPLISNYFNYVIFSIILGLFIFSLFTMFYASSGKTTFKFKKVKTFENNPITEFKEILEESVELFKQEYSQGSNPIVDFYKQICNFLERRGIENAPHLTAKEFEKKVYEILGMKLKGFDVLTNLFEEARYSEHKINEEKIKFCESLVKEMIKELENNG